MDHNRGLGALRAGIFLSFQYTMAGGKGHGTGSLRPICPLTLHIPHPTAILEQPLFELKD